MYGTGSYSYNKYGTRTTSGYSYPTSNTRKSSTNPITGETPSYQRQARDSYEDVKQDGPK